MFYYYGGKKRLAKRYMFPLYQTIIEPFAGAAGYAMHWRDRDVILIDKDKRICDLWEYLIMADPQEILSLPLVKPGERADAFGLTQVQEDLIRYYAAPGARMGMVAQPFSKWHERKRAQVAQLVTEIRHWRVVRGSYEDAPDVEATWFIDPPYQFGGEEYRESNKNLDYAGLLEWVNARRGQVIVCENDQNTWLPAHAPIAKNRNVAGKHYNEVAYERAG